MITLREEHLDGKVLQCGVYRHFKGGRYYAQKLALHSETEDLHVVYHSVETGKVFVRPLALWVEEVEWPDGQRRPRFVLETQVEPSPFGTTS